MKIIIFIIIASVFSIPNGEQNITKAKQLIVQKQYAQAISILEKEAEPKARYYEGWCYYKLSQCSKAIPQFNLFIANYEGVGNDQWKEEALGIIASCGGTVTPEYETSESVVEVDDAKEVREALVNQLFNSSSENATMQEVLNSDPTEEKELLTKSTEIPSPQNKTTDSAVDANFTEQKKEVEEPLFFESKNLRNHYKVLLDIQTEPDKQYISLSSLGPVYTEKISPTKYAYYIGHHSNLDKALKMAKNLKRRGYNESRVLLFDAGQLVADNVTEEIPVVEADFVEDTDRLVIDPAEISSPQFEKTEPLVKADIEKDVVNNPSSSSSSENATREEVSENATPKENESLTKPAETSTPKYEKTESVVETEITKDVINTPSNSASSESANSQEVLKNNQTDENDSIINPGETSAPKSETTEPLVENDFPEDVKEPLVNNSSNSSSSEKAIIQEVSKDVSSKEIDNEQLTGKNVKPTNADNSKTYVISFHVYKNSKIDVQVLSDLGEIKIIKQGADNSFTIYTIGQFDNFKDAKEVLNKVKSAGIKTAYIGADKN